MTTECDVCSPEPTRTNFLTYYGEGFVDIFDDMPEIYIALMSSITHIITTALTCFMAFRCFQLGFRQTAMHAHLCTVGFVFLMSEGIMVRWKGNIVHALIGDSHHALHGFLQVFGGTMGIVGSLQKYYGKEARHFESTHAKLGLMACIFCILNFFTGFITLYYPSCHNPVRIIHSIFGMITYFLGIFAQLYGYSTGFFHRNFIYKGTYKFCTFVIMCLCAIGPLKIVLKRVLE